jgi:hypothetical protein
LKELRYKQMNEESKERFEEIGESVFFYRAGLCFHKSFVKRFEGKNIVETRRLLKRNYTHSQQDDIIAFLKHKRVIS